MTYDNTDTNADGTVDAEVDNSLIDTANGELKGDVDVKNNDVDNVGAVQAEGINSIRYAKSPDDINTQFSKLPNHGGIVRLVPDTYDDSDWTSRIEIPTKEDAFYGLDMTGSKINLDSFSPDKAYIIRNSNSSVRPQPIAIKGPSYWTVDGVPSPAIGLQLWDIENSFVYVPQMKGRFPILIDKRAETGSGHYNQFYVKGRDMDVGYRIGKSGDPQTADRSYYYGQLDILHDCGVEINYGGLNRIHAQPENDEFGVFGSGDKADGIRIGNGINNRCNIVYNTHSGVSTPLNIKEPSTSIRHPMDGDSTFKQLIDSKIAVPVSNIEHGNLQSESLSMTIDPIPLLSKGGEGNATIRPAGYIKLTSSNTDNSADIIQTQTDFADLSVGGLLNARVNPFDDSNAVYQVGIYNSSLDHVMFEYDAANSTTWNAKVVVDGTTLADVDTGVIAEAQGWQNLYINANESRQSFSLEGQHGHVATENISALNDPRRIAAKVITDGSPPSDREMGVSQLGWVGETLQ